jgi:hypothetical protein
MAAVTYGTVRSLILSSRSCLSYPVRQRIGVGLTRWRRWFYGEIALGPGRKPDLCRTSGKSDQMRNIVEQRAPGSAITAKSDLPEGDHLSTAKNCSPVLDNSFGPNEFARAEKKFGYRGRPI